jgi:hypothetical protein
MLRRVLKGQRSMVGDRQTQYGHAFSQLNVGLELTRLHETAK